MKIAAYISLMALTPVLMTPSTTAISLNANTIAAADADQEDSMIADAIPLEPIIFTIKKLIDHLFPIDVV